MCQGMYKGCNAMGNIKVFDSNLLPLPIRPVLRSCIYTYCLIQKYVIIAIEVIHTKVNITLTELQFCFENMNSCKHFS